MQLDLPLAPLLVSLLLAAAGPPADPADAPARGGVDVLVRPGTVLVLGEIHGTAEFPALIGDVAERAVGRGQGVTVALELPRDEQPLVDAYLASDGEDAARAALLEGESWRRPAQDGRNSEAMLALLDRLRPHFQAGRARVALVDRPEPPSGRDRAMADAVLALHRERPTDVVLVLVGNHHARVTVGTPFDAGYESMAYRLRPIEADAGFHLVSLLGVYSGGEAWICQGMTPDTCGAVGLGGRADGEVGTVTLHPAGSDEAFDGTVHVGPLTASPPAL